MDKVQLDDGVYVSASDYAKMHGVTPRTVRNWIKSGRFRKGSSRQILEVKKIGIQNFIKI